jgi:hypothetical protein
MPLSRWSSFELACEAIEAGIVVDISASTVARWPAADAIKPRQCRAPRAPDFASKAAIVLDLYARVFDGAPRGPGDCVLCSDEKISIQARCRCHPTLPPGKARMTRVEHEYQRGGALAYLAGTRRMIPDELTPRTTSAVVVRNEGQRAGANRQRM